MKKCRFDLCDKCKYCDECEPQPDCSVVVACPKFEKVGKHEPDRDGRT